MARPRSRVLYGRGREVYGVRLRSVLLRCRPAHYAGYTGPLLYWGVRLYWAAIRGHSVEELLQPAPFNKPRSWEKESASERTFDKQDRYKARHHFVFNEVRA